MLTGTVQKMNEGNRSYCMAYKGRKSHNVAMETCKKLNAKLPLPKSKEEAESFRKITEVGAKSLFDKNVWIGIRDLTKSGVKENWKDVEGNPIGSAYVNQKGHKSEFLSYFFVAADPAKSGNLILMVIHGNLTKMEQLRIGVLMEVYMIQKKLICMRLGACRKSVSYNFTSKIQLRLNLNNV